MISNLKVGDEVLWLDLDPREPHRIRILEAKVTAIENDNAIEILSIHGAPFLVPSYMLFKGVSIFTANTTTHASPGVQE
jgi:hypothetical protein